jgi:phosphate transport system protein
MEHLHTMLLEMGARCESAIAGAVKALDGGDGRYTTQAIALEEEINRYERDIEALCLKLILQQQPVARDLRQISSALKMITDMERIGDQALDIAEIARLGNVQAGKNDVSMAIVQKMALAAIGMVTDSINAYVQQNMELARQVVADDDKVDELFDEEKRQLAADLADGSVMAESMIDLLMVAKYLERIGDHAVNIAQWVMFAQTGIHEDEK